MLLGQRSYAFTPGHGRFRLRLRCHNTNTALVLVPRRFLRSQTPDGVEQELYALSLGHFVVRALMLQAATGAGLDVDRLSFTGCLRILQARLPESDNTTPAALEQWYRLLLEELAHERTEPRRNRVNPRVVKRKMSKFAKKRPEHRHRPPLELATSLGSRQLPKGGLVITTQ